MNSHYYKKFHMILVSLHLLTCLPVWELCPLSLLQSAPAGNRVAIAVSDLTAPLYAGSHLTHVANRENVTCTACWDYLEGWKKTHVYDHYKKKINFRKDIKYMTCINLKNKSFQKFKWEAWYCLYKNNILIYYFMFEMVTQNF